MSIGAEQIKWSLGASTFPTVLGQELSLRWEDLRMPATSVNPTGPVAPAIPDTTKPGLLFSNGADKVIHMVTQMPHAWLQSSTIIPHIHWEATANGAGTVKWNLQYCRRVTGQVYSATDLGTVTADASGTADTLQYTTLGEISMGGYSISSCLQFILTRTGTADTYGDDVRLLEFDIHYQVDSRGSRDEGLK